MDKAPQFLRGSSFPAHICAAVVPESCGSLLLSSGIDPDLSPSCGIGEETEAQICEMVDL